MKCRRSSIVFILFIVVLLAAAGSIPATAAGTLKTVQNVEAAKKAKLSGLTRIGSRLFYFKQGTMTKNAWKKVSGKLYYFGRNGAAATGAKKIRGKYWRFDENGILMRSGKNRIVSIDGVLYFIKKNGQTSKGWHIKGNRMYYSDSRGKLAISKKVSGITLNEQGYAPATKKNRSKILSALDKKCLKILGGRKKGKGLRYAWKYMTSRSRFRYGVRGRIFSCTTKKSRSLALRMLKGHVGTCYEFACAFAALAKCAGYKAYVVYGYCTALGGGKTTHSWVYISGKGYFDPEAQFAGWSRGIYGVRHSIYQEVKRCRI